MRRETVDTAAFNASAVLPYQLRLKDFELAMQDIYDFFHDVNVMLTRKGLHRLDDMLRPAAMSGVISDMLTASLAKHSRSLVENNYHNGHPDLVLNGIYPNNAVQSGQDGVEIKSTRKRGGQVDMHGACVSSATRLITKRSQQLIASQCVSRRSISARSKSVTSERTNAAN